MPLPSVRDAIYQLLHTGAITQDAADLYLRNYELFPRKRTEIESTHPHMWVAAIDEQIIAEPSKDALLQRISRERGAERAYIEHIDDGVACQQPT